MPRRHRLTIVLCLVGLVAGLAPAVYLARAQIPGPSIAPAEGSLFGAYVQPDDGTHRSDVERAVTGLEAQLGRKLAVDHHYFPWGRALPGWQAGWDVSNGRVPMVTWGDVDVADVNAGVHDAYIAERADAVKAVGHPVLLRFFAEMDAGAKSALARTPAEFISAWKRARGIFESRGATNAAWVWCPTAHAFKTGEAQKWYPGNAWVEWVCADGYNWAPLREGSTWKPFRDVFAHFYEWGLTTGKPLMVGETGVLERNPGEKAQWIRDALAATRDVYPQIKVFLYFDALRHEPYGTYDWRLDTSPGSLAAYVEASEDPYFDPAHLATLTVTGSGAGAGSVVSIPAGVDCGATCTGSFSEGTVVTLTAAPEVGSVFEGWSGACTGTGSSCTVALDASASVTATFRLQTHLLTVGRSGTGTGTVTTIPAGVTCGADCSEAYPAGTSVRLVAAPAAGSAFAGWSGPCAGAALECVVAVHAPRSVTAVFDAIPPGSAALTVLRSGQGDGVVDVAPGGMRCAVTCLLFFVEGESVTLDATPEPGSRFVGWTGGCSGAVTPCGITMSGQRVVTADFGRFQAVHRPETEIRSTRGGRRRAVVEVGIGNGGNVADSYLLQATRGSRRVRVRYFEDGTNITPAAVAGTHVLEGLAPGADTEIRMVVKPKRRVRARGRKSFPITVTSLTQAGAHSGLTPVIRLRRR